jgi:hypothetical protein
MYSVGVVCMYQYEYGDSTLYCILYLLRTLYYAFHTLWHIHTQVHRTDTSWSDLPGTGH